MIGPASAGPNRSFYRMVAVAGFTPRVAAVNRSVPGSVPALHNSRCRTAEQIHLRLLNERYPSAIAIGRGAEPTAAFVTRSVLRAPVSNTCKST